MKDEPLAVCPNCQAKAPDFKRLIGSGAGVVFKGSGFYETDYKRSGSTASSEAKPSGAGKSDSCGKNDCCSK